MNEKGRPGVMLYFDFWHGLKKLNLAEKGALVDAMMTYSETGAEPDFDGVLAVLWDLAKLRVDADSDRYSARCERQRENALKRWNKNDNAMACGGINGNAKNANDAKYKYNSTTNTTTNTNIESKADKPPRSRFSPPTVEQVTEYCRERGNAVDAQRFVDYYSSNGWMVGKSKMKDWRAAVRNWERSEQNGASRRSSKENERGGGIDANSLYGLVPDVCG